MDGSRRQWRANRNEVAKIPAFYRICACAFALALLICGARLLHGENAWAAGCDPLANEIVCENSKTGNPPGEWDALEAGDPSCPCSIWDDSFTAAQDSDPGSVEVGVKFRSDRPGFVTAVRFYKTTGNSGPHVGHLWTADGTQLAGATFTGESASGWQTVTFDSPVSIDADATYIASYHAPHGHYADLPSYFSPVGADSGPLHALADGADGGNGVFRYGPSGSLFAEAGPESFNATNYMVDVVFESHVESDTTPPTINGELPADGAVEISTRAGAGATFDEGMDPSTFTSDTVQLRDPTDSSIPAVVSYEASERRLRLAPSSPLQHSTAYTVTVKGGASGVTDLAGNPLVADASWSFTTGPAPPAPPDSGPGGPILVISNEANPFSHYYAEILRAEGMNEFSDRDISSVTPAALSSYDVVILGEGSISAGQAQMLSAWVQQGGNLVAMRPGPQLAGLLGLADDGGALANAYLKVDTGTAPGAGVVGQTIQFHGAADRYTATDAQTVASLYSDATTPTPNPAVTLRSVGPDGGQAAAFSYDLAKSVVYTRQGNPEWAGEERDGSAPIRSDDLFFGAKAGDEQPDWVDLNKVAIPQADEQQRLLTNLIERMNVDRKPLPRFWFLPRDDRAAIVMTGDDHANGGTVGRFDQYEEDSPPGCVVADWQCVRSTSYVFPNTPITDAQATSYSAAGFEIGLHALTNCADWTDRAQLESFYSSQLDALADNFPSLPAPSTARTHCITWSDWATQPKVELENGMRLDTNYYYWPGSWVKDRPGMFTGSGMPMRFADLDGSTIDVYQAPTQMTDESEQTYPFTVDTLLDNALGPDGYYGVFTANMHTDEAESAGSDAIVAAAQARGVPIVSGRQMLNWLDGRNQSSFGSIDWAGNRLDFTIGHASGANGLRAMLPISSSAGNLARLEQGNAPVATTTETIKGIEYAFFDAATGSYTAHYGAPTPPTATIDSISKDLVGVGGSTDVRWHADENGAFSLRVGGADCGSGSVVDSGAYSTRPTVQTSTVSAAELAEGANELRLCLTNGASDTGTATAAVSRDTIAPDTHIAGDPGDPSGSGLASFSFGGDDGSGSGVASFQCSLDGAAFATCASPQPYSSLDDGSHGFEVRAIDLAGNVDSTPASFTWTVDTAVPPAPTLTGTVPASPANDNSPEITGSAPAGTTIRLYSGADCTGSVIATATAADLATGITASVPDNSVTSFRATATSAAGNVSACSAPLAYVEDSTVPPAPSLTIDSLSKDSVGVGDSSDLNWHADQDGTFQLRLGGDCAAGAVLDSGAYSSQPAIRTSTIAASQLAEGANTLILCFADPGGNTDQATFSVVKDTIAPETQIDSGPSGTIDVASATFAFSSEPGASFECRLDGGTFTACTSPAVFSSLGSGFHSFEVRATDSVHNMDATPAAATFTVDTAAPTVDTAVPPTPGPAGPAASTKAPSAGVTSAFVRLLRVRYNQRQGIVILVCEVPGPGRLSARTPEESARRRPPKAGARSAAQVRRAPQIVPKSVIPTQAGRVKLPVALTPGAQKLLLENPQLRIKVEIDFEAADRSSSSRTLTITLKRKIPQG